MIAVATKDDMMRACGLINGFAGHEIKEASFVEWWGKMLDAGLATVLYRESGTKLREGIGVLFFDNPLTGDKSASISFWWVDKSERNSLVKGLLFARMYMFLKGIGCKAIYASPVLNHNFKEYQVFLERQGFRATEVQFKKEIS